VQASWTWALGVARECRNTSLSAREAARPHRLSAAHTLAWPSRVFSNTSLSSLSSHGSPCLPTGLSRCSWQRAPVLSPWASRSAASAARLHARTSRTTCQRQSTWALMITRCTQALRRVLPRAALYARGVYPSVLPQVPRLPAHLRIHIVFTFWWGIGAVGQLAVARLFRECETAQVRHACWRIVVLAQL